MRVKSAWMVGLIVMAMTLAGCMTAPRDLAFAPSSPRALAVNASPPQNGVARWAYIQRIENGQFGSEYVMEIAMGTSSQLNGGDRLVALSAHDVPPGDYAITEIGIRDAGNGAMGLSWVCTDRLAPVYTLAAGSIAIIRTDAMYPMDVGGGGAPSDEDVLQEFERSRARFPNLVGTAAIVEPSYWITFRTSSEFRPPGDRCRVPVSYTVRPAPERGELAVSGIK